jgi:predicted transcriptional regulator
MGSKEKKHPTNAELEILQVLWERGPSTVRQVYKELAATREPGYTTVLKLMQIMTEKGLLIRDLKVRPQVYRVAQPQSKTQRILVGDLLERAFKGSPGSLVLQALSTNKATPEELKKIRDLLDKLEEKQK